MDKSQVLIRAKEFIYDNARLLDRKRYEYHFEGGTSVDVINVLRNYQNPDGGFGNALEPDIRCPQSQPVPTEMALGIMEEVNHAEASMIKGIAKYLHDISLEQGSVPYVFKHASEYSHAPWWSTEDDTQPSINPIGRLVGLLYKQKACTDFFLEDWFKKHEQYIWNYMDHETPHGYHDIIQLITFLENTPDRNKAEIYQSRVDDYLLQPGVIERDPQAEGYVQKVLDWCPLSSSYPRKFVTEEDIKTHLQALLDQQQEDGGWTISWPAVSIGTECEWRGWVTVDRLRTLKSYGIL